MATVSRFFVLTTVICLLSIGAQAQITIAIPGDPVRIDSGLVAGSLAGNGIKTYFGIPFAAPPIRESRWRAPQPVAGWDGVLTANRLPPECVQRLRSPSINHYFGDELSGEDCLYLNIWAPASSKAGDKLPVLVWIYGGAFNVGSASSPIYGGAPLASKGVIYVAINYRVGVMGFLAHPELTRESGHNASGNWGFLDQLAGLQWVRKNISAFGGDADNVTLIGQSAGSMSITNLQASPLARGLFQRVIGMSGTTLEGGAGRGDSLSDAEAKGMQLQQALEAQGIEELRSMSSDKIFTAVQDARIRVSPSIDGYFLPRTVDEIFAAGEQSDVAVLTGSTADDIGTRPAIRGAKTVEEYAALAKQNYGDKAGELLRLFPAATDADAVRQANEIGRNSGFSTGARNWAKAQHRTGKAPAYLFIVSRVQPFTPGVTFSDFNPQTAGAYHMGDVPYFLGTYEAFNLFRTTRSWTALDRELSEKMQDVVVSFATSGNPSTDAVPFAAYDPENERRIDFGDSIMSEKLYSEGLDFIANTPVLPQPQ